MMGASLQAGRRMTTSLRASASGPLQRATGWTATRSAPALPATCALHREGSNSALYLSPAPVGAVARWLDLPGEDQAVLLDPEPGVSTRVLPWSALAARSADADVVHLPATASLDPDSLAALPSPLLAALAEAVPRALGGRVAISAADSGHTVVVSRERRLLARCLDGFLRALILRGNPIGPAGASGPANSTNRTSAMNVAIPSGAANSEA